jgi:Na+-translocating ferredoxin:NAD+ oxidoreductase RnfG subunit
MLKTKMKGVFNRAALLLAVSVITSGLAASGHAQVYYSVRGLLAEQFRQSELVDFQRIQLSGDRREGIERRLGQKLEKSEYILYVARSADHIDGYALFDREIGQHEYIDFATFFDRDGRVTRVEVVAYREPYGEGIRSKRFRKQFVGKEAASGFRPGHDIDVISGATLSARARAKAVKRATVLLRHAVLTSS